MTWNVQDKFAPSVAFERLMVLPPPVAEMVPPPHDPNSPGGVEMTSPDGRLSVKPTPLNDVVFGFWTVKLNEVMPFTGMIVVPNEIVTVGGGSTFRLAEAVLPGPALVDVTVPVVFVRSPPMVPLTVTLNVQELLTPIVAPESVTLLEPAVAVMVPPPQVPFKPLGVARISPGGNESLKPTPVSAAVFAAGFVMVNMSEVVPLMPIFSAPNALLMTGGTIPARVADAGAPAPPSADVTADVVMLCDPLAVSSRFTLNVHEAPPFRVAADKLILPPPAAALMVPPPHVPV